MSQRTALAYEVGQGHVIRLYKQAARERSAYRRSKGLKLGSKENWKIERAYVMRIVTSEADQTRKAGEVSVLLSMWYMYVDGDWRRISEEDTFEMFMQNDDVRGLGNDIKPAYRQALIYAVERVLAYVNAFSVYDSNGEKITPERLIAEAGVGRLKNMSWRIGQQTDIELRHKYIRDLIEFNGDYADLRYHWDNPAPDTSAQEPGQENAPEPAKDPTIVSLKLPSYQYSILPNSRVAVNWSVEMTESQFRVLSNVLSRFCDGQAT